LFLLFSSSTYPPAPPSPLFPYTTLFRSAFARRRRFRGHHLFPTKAGPFPCGILDPFPRGVLIYPATATAKKNNCFQIWIERGRPGVDPRRLRPRKLQSPARAIIRPRVHRIDGSKTTK